eukprot:CAMPEP_0202352524 /NCGR_PEP_ID=MMETSP1126-20121109/8681_1 /ASSEMBLY_ACC=CAM_ASM_000457 /TAXON_ID=3047 /ORGANISM="Dunaliella tertiolecta, Strain CCMP1320" /LENGTH=207 /DNA_ID=CAMNT_0048944751 /DNA_START=14 /DNA_END=635 /DNA_ORIENTATION=+
MTELTPEQQQPKVDEQPKTAENAPEQPASGEGKEQPSAAVEQPAEEVKEQPAAAAEQPAEGVREQPLEKKRKREEPALLGYCKFNHAVELVNYYKHLLSASPKNLDMNEYEHMALLGLLKQHPEWDRKVGPGIKSFQVRDIDVHDGKAKAFFAMRKDGSMEDFSYIKLQRKFTLERLAQGLPTREEHGQKMVDAVGAEETGETGAAG